MKKYVIVLVLLFSVNSVFSQCAMCKKAAQDAGGINDGIIYIMVFPYIILASIGAVIYFRYKKLQKLKNN